MQPEGYQHHITITVRFADLDAMGHLNHAKYLTYMEQARILYIRDVCGFEGTWQAMGMILARVTCDYHLPVAFGDTISIYTRCSRLGGKSFDLSYVLVNSKNEQVATGQTVMVTFDYQANASMPIPDDWRTAMMAYDGL